MPWDIRGTEHQHTSVVVANAIHLHEEFRFDASGTLRLAFVPSTGERVHLVYENDSRFGLACHLEELLDESAASHTHEGVPPISMKR